MKNFIVEIQCQNGSPLYVNISDYTEAGARTKARMQYPSPQYTILCVRPA